MYAALVLTAALSVLDIAHRGASAQAPENTLAAFRLAAEQHADLFELDVQETRDHRLVVVHDPTLSRTTDAERVYPGRAPWRVRDLTLAQIRRLDAGHGQRVPTLGETLDVMEPTGLGLLLEIKKPELYPGIERRVARELRAHPAWLGPGRVIVQSFDWSSVRRFHRELRGVPTAVLGTPADLPAVARYADYVNAPYRDVTTGYVRRVHARGMKLFAWTVDSPAVIRRMARAGVDGIVTNRPGYLSGATIGR